ncbi:MAG: DUF2142 domain-containing protein [Anaerolineae bacterium]
MPRSLGLILAAYLLLGAAYAVITPPWQTPDEPAHYNYIRYIVETGSLPVLQPGDYQGALLEDLKAHKWPPDASVDALRYEGHQPPLFYVVAAPVYALAHLRLSTRGVVISLRLLSVLLGAVVVYLAYLITRRALPEMPTLALVTAGFVAFLPMHIAMTAAVNNDTLAELILSAILFLSLGRLLGRVSQRRFVIGGAVLVGLAMLTKTTIYLPAVALPAAAELGGWWRRNRFGLGAAIGTLAMLYFGALLISAWWFLRNMDVYGAGDPFGWTRHDTIVFGEQLRTSQYLAQTGVLRALREGIWTVFQSFWGIFGWMGAPFPAGVYWLLAGLTVLAAVGLALLIFSRRHPRPAVWLLVVPIVCALAGLVGYNLKFIQFQGRYLFPALTPIAVFFALGLREVAAREHERILAVLSVAAIFALALFGLWYVIRPGL